MGDQFVRHTKNLLNLGLNSSAYRIRFTIVSANTSKKWLLFCGWPNVIDKASPYIPKIDSSGWIVKEVGRRLPDGPDPLPSRPAGFLPDSRRIEMLTIYPRVESAEAKQIPLQIPTAESYPRRSKQRFLGFGVYYGNEAVLPLYIFHQTIILCPKNPCDIKKKHLFRQLDFAEKPA